MNLLEDEVTAALRIFILPEREARFKKSTSSKVSLFLYPPSSSKNVLLMIIAESPKRVN